MRTVAIEELMASTVEDFCANSAELGCPKDKDVDMWFRELSNEEQFDIMSKLIEIQDRDDKIRNGELCSGCGKEPHPNIPCEEAAALRNDEVDEWPAEDVIMKRIRLDLEEDLIERILEIARSKVVNDKEALIEYGVNYMLKEMIELKGHSLDETDI